MALRPTCLRARGAHKPEATNLPETGITDSAVVNDTLPPVVLTYPQILLDMNNAHVEQDSLITMLMEEKTTSDDSCGLFCAFHSHNPGIII